MDLQRVFMVSCSWMIEEGSFGGSGGDDVGGFRSRVSTSESPSDELDELDGLGWFSSRSDSPA
jgi:hypothetical protein